MTKELYLETAAQAWCQPSTRHIEMNIALAEAFSQILAARERAVWLEAAKLCEHEYDASHDRDAVFYECLLTIAGLCRQQAEEVKP